MLNHRTNTLGRAYPIHTIRMKTTKRKSGPPQRSDESRGRESLIAKCFEKETNDHAHEVICVDDDESSDDETEGSNNEEVEIIGSYDNFHNNWMHILATMKRNQNLFDFAMKNTRDLLKLRYII